MGVQIHHNLTDSTKGKEIKKREQKHNQKIQNSIEKMKYLYRHRAFYDSIVPPKVED